MSEKILKALMQLFAIIAKVDGITNDGRTVVQNFLKQQLNQELVEEYLKLFDEFVEIHQKVSSKKEGAAKRTSLGSVKILKICTQINAELEQKQKLVVLIRILEFIHTGNEISEQELEFVTTVAETFNIPQNEFGRCMSFVQSVAEKIPESAHCVIIDNQKHEFAKTKHILSEQLSGQIRLLAVESVNTYAVMYLGTSELNLNGQAFVPNRVYIFTPGSSIRSSKVPPIYYSDVISCFLSDTSVSKISFCAKDVQYKFKAGNIGLQSLNLYEESGKLIGIMGGSGAGKSTCLNVLNGNETPSSGAVTINGYSIHNEKDKIDGVIGYVSQDDLLIEQLTVYQNLFYNAKLCFDHLKDAEISQKVMDLLNDIGLYEARNLKVGSPLEKTISGGQRKRLNIALELIRQPSVMFVDEPTSGLSSSDSENIMDLLKELSLKGKLIFVVIHQPSSEIFKMFDKLLILDVGGYTIYYGNPVDGLVYFKKIVSHVNSDESECVVCGNVNPELIFNIIGSKVVDEYGNFTRNRKISAKEWNVYYNEKNTNKIPDNIAPTELPEISFKVPNKFNQFKVFITRDVLSKLTNKQYLFINLFEAPFLAFILAFLVKYFSTDISNTVGYIFRENENLPVYMFMSVIVALFIGLTVSAEEIIGDRKILKREKFLNLSRSSYLCSKIVIMFVLSAIQTLTYILVGNTLLEIKGMNMDYWLILFTTSCFANMLGLNISSAFNEAVTVYILIPFLLVPQLLLSGIVVKFDKLNPIFSAENTVPWPGEMMASRWAFEALAVNQFKANKFDKQFYGYDKIISNASFKKDFWISKIESKVGLCEDNINDPAKKVEVTEALNLLRTELELEQKLVPTVKYIYTFKIKYPDFGNPTVIAETRNYVAKLNKYYVKRYNKATDEREKIVSRLNSTDADKELFLKAKNDYENESLEGLLKNKNEINKILEKNGELIQRADPVHLDPVRATSFRSHFYAPRKKFFGGRYMDTFWLNIMVIWAMSVTLILFLYFDVFRKIIDGTAELVGRFSGK